MSILSKLFGDPNQKSLNQIQPMVRQINQLEQKFESFSDEELKNQTQEFKKRLSQSESLDDILVEAFACCREAAKRTIGQRHYDVQLIGGLALHQGKITEMKTGEGKTLSATLALYLNALSGQGAHLVTVNDYLARRDTNWMGPIFHLLGLSVSCINHEKSYLFEPAGTPDKNEVTVEMENLRSVSRQEAYQADITYGTNNEFGFDYLRDNMAQNLKQIVQRPLHYAIIDEVDSILIDEARTPLIISAPDTESTKMYQQFARLTPQLKENADYNVDEKMRAVTLTEEGIAKIENILGMGNIYQEGGMRYVHHLEQALRAQVLFRRDHHYVVKDGQVVIVDEFTGRLMPGRRFSEGLHQALEAKENVQVQRESRTLASITFQNYFRFYQKIAGMTGTALTSAEEFHKVYQLDVLVIPTNKPMIRFDAPDVVYRTEKGKFQALVQEIKESHQKGQPVLVGTVSIEKNERLAALLKREGVVHQILNAKNHEQEARIIAQAGAPGAVTIATNMAGRGVDIILGGRIEEKQNREDWLSQQKSVIEAGGLKVIGTERHEARRIDNQLRGRAGRQGDPGFSQFFISLEDDLMRVFAPERIKKMMELLKIPEDQPIESKMISKAIESAQSKIEGFNFDLRKHILEYDDVMNKQRNVIYAKRRKILEARNLKDEIIKMIEDEIKKFVGFHTADEIIDNWRFGEIYEIAKSIFSLPVEARHEIQGKKSKQEIIDYLLDLAHGAYEIKEKEIGAENLRQIEKMLLLRTIDMFWMDHLENMDYLRDSVRLRAYGQRDPLVEYKNEGQRMFRQLLASIQMGVVNTIYKVTVAPAQSKIGESVEERQPVSPSVADVPTIKKPVSSIASSVKIGRNDHCPCGSGKKYKRCHGR